MLYDSLFGAENNIAVASCGSAFSLHQFELLRNLGVQEIVFAFDRQFEEIGDKEFQRHVKHIKQLGDKYKNFVTISICALLLARLCDIIIEEWWIDGNIPKINFAENEIAKIIF